MGSNRGGGGGGVGVGLKEIPMGSRKMVMSLKEIVNNNCSESEIYATLQDCNMDPNEAVNRLLSQDPFHEVKSKREKKKENKDTSEGRSRGASSTSSWGGRSGADRYGRGGSAQFSSESGTSHGKPVYKKENSSALHAGSLSTSTGLVGNTNKQPPALSDAASNDNKVSWGSSFDGISPVPQPSSAYQMWVGAPGQVSMADIVKMGRPQNKTAGTQKTSENHVQGPLSDTSHHNLHFPEDNAPKVSDVNSQSGGTQQASVDDEWPLIEPLSAASVPSGVEPPADTNLHPDPAKMPYGTIDRHDQTDDIQAVNDGAVENLVVNHVGSAASVSSSKMQDSSSGGVSLFDNDLYKNMGSYQAHNLAIEHHEVQEVGVLVSSVTANLQQLNIQKEVGGLPSEGNTSSVVIPDHLQVQTADCSHLSFGSFKVGGSISAPLASMPVKTNLEEAATEVNASSVDHLEPRTSEYYGDNSYRDASDGNLYHRAGASSSTYNSALAPEREALRPENPEIEQGHQYAYSTSTPGYSFENTQQGNVAFSHSQTSSQTQNLASFSNVMAHTNSLPNTLLAANVHPGREPDLQYSPFPTTQMPEKFGNAVSSISDSAISMPEALKNVGLPSAQPAQHQLSGSSLAAGPSLPQHLAMHPYSQPTLPLGPFTNMLGYPFLPQSYTYMPSGFQQAFPGNSTYHQSLAAVLPQYKNSVSVSSLPQSAAVASGYGAFGNTTTIPSNFPMNPPAAPSSTTLGYDDVLSTQYKDNSHLMSLQQSDNSAMWLQGPGSRTMSAVPSSTYYTFQGQNQQVGGFRQDQQPSQSYGTVGYPNFYHSQAGMLLDHQQQNPREASLGGSQGQPKQSQQIWQNSY